MAQSVVFEILKLRPDGSEQWFDYADSFRAALFQAELADIESPGKYVIRDQTR